MLVRGGPASAGSNSQGYRGIELSDNLRISFFELFFNGALELKYSLPATQTSVTYYVLGDVDECGGSCVLAHRRRYGLLPLDAFHCLANVAQHLPCALIDSPRLLLNVDRSSGS